MSLVPSKSSALARSATDAELMPPPNRIKRPKNVLDEDSYTGALSDIIARDFFPGLQEAETQHEYLDALDSRDEVWISSVRRRLEQSRGGHGRISRRRASSLTTQRAVDTPRGIQADTPVSVVSEATSINQASRRDVKTDMSLDKFQSLYTSEDNESFYKLVDKQNGEHRRKHAWMYSTNNKLPSKMMLKQREVNNKLLKSQNSESGRTRNGLTTDISWEKPARPEAWKARPKNPLMFLPDSIEDSVETQAQRLQNESRAAQRGIAHMNTRIQSSDTTKQKLEAPLSPSASAVRNAIAGFGRDSDLGTSSEGNETSLVNGYTFVDDEVVGEQNFIPMVSEMVTKRVIKNPFVIREQSSREDLHHRIVDRNAKTKRASLINASVAKSISTPIPRFPSSPRVGDSAHLTPAGQRLLGRVGFRGASPSSTFDTKTPLTAKRNSRLRSRWTTASPG